MEGQNKYVPYVRILFSLKKVSGTSSRKIKTRRSKQCSFVPSLNQETTLEFVISQGRDLYLP